MTVEDINSILDECKSKGYLPTKADIAFHILYGIVGTEAAGFLLYKAPLSNPEKYLKSPKTKLIRQRLIGLGVDLDGTAGKKSDDFSKENLAKALTKDQNKEEMLLLIEKVRGAAKKNLVDMEYALTYEKDIRTKLQDKFDMEKSDDERRIIVVPQKHDKVCPYTHKECTDMPTKEVCMQYYNLVEKEGGNG